MNDNHYIQNQFSILQLVANFSQYFLVHFTGSRGWKRKLIYNGKRAASQCISRSMELAEGGSEPMKINLFIGYILND